MEASDTTKENLFGTALVVEIKASPEFEAIKFFSSCQGSAMEMNGVANVAEDDGPKVLGKPCDVTRVPDDILESCKPVFSQRLGFLFDELENS